MIEINISNDYSSDLQINNNQLKKNIKFLLKDYKVSNALVSFILTNRKKLSQLKKEYFNLDQYTDVISFNLSDNNDCIEGEIYISIDDVKENSEKFDQKFDIEFKRVLIHGVLHILGFEDTSDKEKKNMRNLENKYLNKIDSSAIIKV